MSSVAATAAVQTRVPWPRRGALRPVPTDGPVVQLELGNPLQLSKTMRGRLLGAVRALVTDPALAEASDGARLASVVLTAKARIRDGYRTSIWAEELGRWLGVSQSTVAHTVLPELRGAGVLGSKVATNAFGHATGLECWVVPMYRAQRAGDRRHALALSRSELAVLLRLLEVLFGPGWAPKDREPVPAGLLAGRSGRGAATDRLGLLLMVLSTGPSGWLRLCPGSVDAGRGRPAATVGRLLGCTAAAGAKVLKRLQEQGVADVVRQESGSGLNGKSRVRLVPVAQAHGRVVREARQAAGAVFSDLAATASGDLVTAAGPGARVNAGDFGAAEGGIAESADLAAAAHHHALHAPVVTAISSPTLSGGFSGEGRGGSGDLPDRACEREEQTVDSNAVSRLTLVGSESGPLRGEQPKKSPSISSDNGNRNPVADGSVQAVDGEGQGRQQRGRVPLPAENLRAVLAPVRRVWARLERQTARQLVESAARSELARVVGLAGRAYAPQVLADRLARRLEDQMRLGGPITDPVGWLIGRGLPQRQECGDTRCDDGALLDSGRDCPRCEDRQVDRRARRHMVAAAVDAAMPHAVEEERRTATERQLHETVTAQAWTRELQWEQVRARQAAAAQARAEAAAAQAAIEPATPPAPVVLPAPRPAVAAPAPVAEAVFDDVDQELVLEELTREQVLDWRTHAAKDHQLVFEHIDRYGEHSAQRLFTRAFVAQVTRLSGLGHLNLGYIPWGQA